MNSELILYADGGSRGNPGPAAAGAVLQDGAGQVVARVSQFFARATNNQAEYAAVILGVAKALELGASELKIFLDSKLIVEQVSGRWKVKDLEIKKAVEKLHALLQKLERWEIQHVPREKNQAADALVNAELDARGFKKKPGRWF
jgi:probable phosphoglycerate mutase